ncbi:hypothetical protein K7432_001082 [Basidiobolus ranarum]|uniref:SAP domain-containing protein n=1 Tax=Basidiobolus ranarum TaxID=34480 RepID=A0ABR2X3K7_9FUNG
MPPVPSLTRFRKFELIEIAEALGLPTEGFRPDIEARIRTYLSENDVSDNLKVASLLNAPRGTTPRKRTSRSTSPAGARSTRSASRLKNFDSESLTPTKPRQQDYSEDSDKEDRITLERPKQPEFFIDAPESAKIQKMFKIEETRLPEMTPPFKSELIETTVVTEETVIEPYAGAYKNSQVWGILLFLLSVELAVLLYSSFYGTDLEMVQLHLWELHSALVLTVPDITNLIVSYSFWKPIITWFMVLILVPFILSYVVNVERDHPTFSPLTFSVIRSAIVYGLGNREDIFGQLYSLIPSSLLHITCVIGLILATYRGVTKPSVY